MRNSPPAPHSQLLCPSIDELDLPQGLLEADLARLLTKQERAATHDLPARFAMVDAPLGIVRPLLELARLQTKSSIN